MQQQISVQKHGGWADEVVRDVLHMTWQMEHGNEEERSLRIALNIYEPTLVMFWPFMTLWGLAILVTLIWCGCVRALGKRSNLFG